MTSQVRPLSTDDVDAAADRFTLTDLGEWGDHHVAWFDADLFHASLGIRDAP